MKQKVVLDPHFRRMTNIFAPEDLARLRETVDLVWARDEPMPQEEMEKVSQDVVAIITGQWRYGDVARFPKLRAVLEVSGGFPSAKDLNYEMCFSRGVRVLSCSPAFGPAVAEMGLALALACARQVVWTDAAFRGSEPNWGHTSFDTEIGTPFTLYGKQAGFIGFGALARSLKPLLEPFKCPIQVYDPWLTDGFLRTQGVTPTDLDTLLKASRLIFALAVPSASNQVLLSREKLGLIGRDAVLLLLSRAQIVDFDAMTEMLAQGRFRAGIDVFPDEPLARDHPIRGVRHAVLSSHRAGAINEALLNIGRIVANDIEAICKGLVPQEMQVAQPEFIRMRGL